MSGLEVVAGVAGIVSAVVSVFNLVKKAAASRKAKKLAIQANVQTAESQLVTTLQGSPNQIYEELHKNLGRAGAAFGRGDGIANSGLMRILLNMNTSLVTALQGSIATGKVLFNVSQYQNWNSIGATATRETVTTLGQLLQRVLQAAPIQPSLSSGFSALGGISARKLITYSDGAKYEGQLNEAGSYHGFGKMNWGDRSTYIGEWVEGIKEGYGKEIYPPVSSVNGVLRGHVYKREYEGTFHDGVPHGYGKYIHEDGTEYVGEWDSNKRHGYGKTRYLDGRWYEGQWSRDERHGYGVYSWSPSVKYEGDWVLSKMQGYGTRTWQSGIAYEGEFRNDNPHGPGVSTYPQGDKYEGYFLDGKFGGYGKYTYRSGKVVEAMWKDDKIDRVLK